MQEKIDVEDIKKKLIDILRPSGWTSILKTFLMSTDFDKILYSLLKEKEEGRRFVPNLKIMFRAFEECPLDKLKVIWILQDPYPQIVGNIPVADGLATSCGNTKIIQPSLDYIFKEIRKSTGINNRDPDLTRWTNQGLLLSNTALSVEISKPGTHQKIWKPFTSFWLDMLNNTTEDLIFVFLGKKAQEFESLIDEDRHTKIFTSHPASAAYNQQLEWNSGGLFEKLDKLLIDKYGETINW